MVREEDRKRVYICLTTVPDRLALIGPTLQQLFTMKCNVVLSLAKDKFSNDIVKNTEILYPNLIVARPTNDLGPGTKLLGALTVVNDDDDVLVVVDDDLTYPPNILATLAHESLDSDVNEVVCVRSWKHKPSNISTFTCHFGIATKRKHIDEELMSSFPSVACARGDDFWLSFCFQKQRTSIRHIGHGFFPVAANLQLLAASTRGFEAAAKGKAVSNMTNYDDCFNSIR